MIDTRFYESLGPVRVDALAHGFDVRGDVATQLSGLARADAAGEDALCYWDGKTADIERVAGAPGACILRAGSEAQVPNARAYILSRNPRADFARLAPMLVRLRFHAGEAFVHETAVIEDGAVIGPGAVIGQGAAIGAGAQLGAHCVIGPGVQIGRRTRIGARALVQCALVGDDVSILAGAIIGETGFGVAVDGDQRIDLPHVGRAIIQDRVVVGANATIDRGLFDDTIIGEDSKIDNLSQIAHNVIVGRGVLIASFGGISGSTRIGDGVMMGGRVGVSDHRSIGAGAVLAAGSAVLHDVPAGEKWAGYPAKPIRRWLRETAWLSKNTNGARHGDK